jgi:hypothetical protein
MMKDVATSIPGHVLAFDPSRQVAQLQIGIVRVDVNGLTFTPPPLIECPVYQYGGKSFAVEVQIDPGDEGVILFSQRCIDAWCQTGGIAQNPILRFHDFSDAYFLPGMRSNPGALPAFQNNGVRLRNSDGSQYFWLKNDGTGEITVDTLTINAEMVHNGNATRNGSLLQNGNINLSGSYTAIAAGGDFVAQNVSLVGHTHAQGNDSDNDAEQETNPPTPGA